MNCKSNSMLEGAAQFSIDDDDDVVILAVPEEIALTPTGGDDDHNDEFTADSSSELSLTARDSFCTIAIEKEDFDEVENCAEPVQPACTNPTAAAADQANPEYHPEVLDLRLRRERRTAVLGTVGGVAGMILLGPIGAIAVGASAYLTTTAVGTRQEKHKMKEIVRQRRHENNNTDNDKDGKNVTVTTITTRTVTTITTRIQGDETKLTSDQRHLTNQEAPKDATRPKDATSSGSFASNTTTSSGSSSPPSSTPQGNGVLSRGLLQFYTKAK